MEPIYLDNASTSFPKPPQVAQAVAEAICKAGNAARGAHGASLSALRTVYDTRCLAARLLGCPRPDHVVFAANSTMALNIAICGLLSPGDHAISTDLEHNSVLQVLPYWNEVVILDGAAKIDKYTYRPIFDSFHSMAVQYITNEEYERACQNALWSKRPGEPVIVDDVSTEVNPEVVAFLNRQCTVFFCICFCHFFCFC